ncbi:Thiol peroxidase, Bcp-type [Clostridiaceae bacterium JG1575]|nr:Thiol peroxidase, Bcp-type [Clostridiaceae bacterium JG1575]
MKSHDKFIDKLGIPFVLLSDEEGDVLTQYGVFKEKSLFGKTALGIIRSTFVIGPDGTLLKIYRKPKPEGHAEEILSFLKSVK